MAGQYKTRIDDEGRVCPRCKIYKTWDNFGLDTRSSTLHNSWCHDCMNLDSNKRRKQHKNSRLLRTYGITEPQYDKIFANQNGKCAICDRKLVEGGHKTNSACVDHCHNTQRVRGILCLVCNMRLGTLENDDFILKAHRYLTNENS